MDPQTPLTTVEKAAFLTEVDLFRDVPSDTLAELAATAHAAEQRHGIRPIRLLKRAV